MTNTQYKILYKMLVGWKLRSSLGEHIWLSHVTGEEMRTVRIRRPTLDVLARNLWVTQAEIKWPILR